MRALAIWLLMATVAFAQTDDEPASAQAKSHGHGHTAMESGSASNWQYIVTHHDRIPDFAGEPTHSITADTKWSDIDGLTPASVVRIDEGVTVVFDTTSRIKAVGVAGSLRFHPDLDTQLTVQEIVVYDSGLLEIGTTERPVTAQAELVIGDAPLDLERDPSQWGNSLLVFGKIRVCGRKINTNYMRLARSPQAGDRELLLEEPVNWREGDRLIVPDTRQIGFTSAKPRFTSQAEVRVIEAVDGSKITLDQPLLFDHEGFFTPHVANLTRNVIFRSENREQLLRRGHTAFTHRADADVRYAAFVGLGRTSACIGPRLDWTKYDADRNVESIGKNHIGRYSIHLHHLLGIENPKNVGYQARIEGCVVEDFAKWGITVHGTHFSLIKDNVVYAGQGDTIAARNAVSGAGIATEDGSESFNVFDHNFVCHSKAGSEQRMVASPGMLEGGVYKKVNGISRDGFWFTGPHNYVRNNVAVNCPDFAFNYNGLSIKALFRVPKFRGADLHDDRQVGIYNPGKRRRDGFIIGITKGLPVLESANNEAYGSTGVGLWISAPYGIRYPKNVSVDKPSVYENWQIWCVTHVGVYNWGADSQTRLRRLVIRNDPVVSASSSGQLGRQSDTSDIQNAGISCGSNYRSNKGLEITDFDVRGFNTGIKLPHHTGDPYRLSRDRNTAHIRNGFLENHINVEWRPPRYDEHFSIAISDVDFANVSAPAGDLLPEPCNIWSRLDNREPHTFTTRPALLRLYNYQGGNYRVFFYEQAADYVLPPYRPVRGAIDPNAPGVGKTNVQALAEDGVCVGDSIAPEDAMDGSSIGIRGLVTKIDG